MVRTGYAGAAGRFVERLYFNSKAFTHYFGYYYAELYLYNYLYNYWETWECSTKTETSKTVAPSVEE